MPVVMIRGFPSLNNYGTGMMGLVTIDRILRGAGRPVRFLCDFAPETDIGEVMAELGRTEAEVELVRHNPVRDRSQGLASRLQWMQGPGAAAGADLVVVLGGDDISEYYRPDVWRRLAPMRTWTRHMPVVLLGQTVGPFDRLPNRLFARHLFPAFHIVPRDRWTTAYLSGEFGLGRNLSQGTDLAYADLPLQHRTDIEAEILQKYGLADGDYATVVVSAMQRDGYYTADRQQYLQRWKEIVEALLDLPAMQNRRICLLAHTFTRFYGDERENIESLLPLLSPQARARVVPITERILQTRARFVLGRGLFTVTGRMHPAVSTFQMGKPAITHAYSKKYEGVIGSMLGRGDLILEVNDPALWSSGEIVPLTVGKAAEVLQRHGQLCTEIRTAIATQRRIAEESLASVVRLLPQRP